MDDLHTIKRYLGKFHKNYEDPLPIKSKDRVQRQMAEQVRHAKPLPEGGCQLCLSVSEKLVPISLKCCRGCVERFANYGGKIRIMGRQFGIYYCDWCMGKTFHTTTINPFICQRCMNKLGNKHMKNMPDIRIMEQKQRARLMAYA